MMSPLPLMKRTLDVLVIGAGQAGLAVGRELERAGRDFLILDGAQRVGDSWRNRWDSLRLFTPAVYSGLRGIPFPTAPDHYPGKDEVADYLANYARAFSMPVALDEPVRDLRQCGGGKGTFVATTDHARYRARQVVVATGPFQAPRVPALAATLPAGTRQLHSSAYRSPAQLPHGNVLVVGGGNSGVQIAAELAAAGSRTVTLAVGTAMTRLPSRVLGRSVFEWLDRSGAMSVSSTSALGRRMRTRDTLIGESPRRIARSHGVRLTTRIVGVEGSRMRAANGDRMPLDAIVWATGFKPAYDWLRVPVLGTDGRPVHRRGVTAVPGLYFIGLPWQHTRGSALLGWVARDAEYLAGFIASN